MLLSPRLQKLHTDSLVVRHWMAFLKTRPSVKRNNASLLMCSTHFTLSCRIPLFFPSPPPTSFSSLCILKSPESLPGRSCLGPLVWQLKVIKIWLTSILDFWYPGPSYLVQEVLVLYFVCIYVLYTKNALKSTQFSRYSTTFFDHFSFLQNWVLTKVLVCPVYALYEFSVLDNSIRLLFLHVCFPVFLPFLYNCCIMDRTYHSHKSCPSTLAPLCHHSSGTLTFLFSSTCLLLLCHVERPC